MNWLKRLREKAQLTVEHPLTELTQGSFVSFVRTSEGDDDAEPHTRPTPLPPLAHSIMPQKGIVAKPPPPPDLIGSHPCPICGSVEKWRKPSREWICRQCLIDGDAPAVIHIWSDILGEAVWVVADDLPGEQWPTDAPVYTHREVRMLRSLGRDVLAVLHMVKQVFTATIVSSTPRVLPGSNVEEGQSEQTKGVDGKRANEDA